MEKYQLDKYNKKYSLLNFGGKHGVVLLLILLFIPTFVVAQDAKKLILLQTGDVHSRIEPVSQKGDRNYNQGGFARRASFLKEFRKANPNVLLFDCGDFSQGTPYYNVFRGELEVKLMNEMKYDVVGIGNHEFDFGIDNLARIFKMAKFSIVCANYNVEATPLKGLVKPFVILKRYGLKIGVFGLGVKPEGLIQVNKYAGMVYEDPIEAANKIAARLKAEGCDVVICLSHLGIQSDENLVTKTRNIDVILGGHSHTFWKTPRTYLNIDGKNVSIMHSGKNGIYVGRTDLILNRK